MKTIWKRFACLAVSLLTPALLCSCEEGQPAQGICYRISGGKNAMVILGSIHVGSPEMEPYGQHLLDEMAKADIFVYECNSDDPSVAAQTASMMALENGTLEELLSPETWQLLLQACNKTGMSVETLNGFRPWAVTSMLTTYTAANQMGVRNSRQAAAMGVEETVQKHAGDRQSAYLESASAQLELLAGFSPALQEALLRQGCEAVLEPKENTSLANWPVWWRDGNAEAFANEYASDDSLPPQLMEEYHNALVTGRNQRMAESLCAMLESEEEHCYFVTIGLMHLVLPNDSVLWELEQRGYTVEQLRYPAE